MAKISVSMVTGGHENGNECESSTMKKRTWPWVAALALLIGGCWEPSEVSELRSSGDSAAPPRSTRAEAQRSRSNPRRSAWFGDLHIHTRNSYEGMSIGVRATPDDAYRYARGEAITHPLGYSVRLKSGPLDFLGVTDHAEYLGVIAALNDPKHPLATHPLAKQIQSAGPKERVGESMKITMKIASAVVSGKPILGLDATDIIRSTWQETIEAAERNNDPGRFTTFVAYEYSSKDGGAGLHRNVVFSGSRVPEVPFGALESPNPEDLWTWLDKQRAKGIEAMAIPHNSNWSLGRMFERTNFAGEPIDAAYAEQRMRNEPLVEVTQVKGTSETHPALSPNDEWADFEIWNPMSKPVAGERGTLSFEEWEGDLTGAYARGALRTGLEMEEKGGFNPYRFGLIGSSDGHDAAGPVEEEAFFGKFGIWDGSPEARKSVPRKEQDASLPLPFETLEWGASGLAGVWAEENTRASIYAGLRRKETFATSGPRIRVRFFAGYGYPNTLATERDAVEQAYAGGVPMGGDLVGREGAPPRFFVWALRDPSEAWLQRAQIVKGRIEDGKSKEQVFDVACSDSLAPDPKTHRCPDNGATVNLTDCSPSLDKGAVELRTVWTDPTFDPDERAFYYARVLQNPTCRWSAWDAIRAGVEPSPKVPATIQERAWSSPIWYAPKI